MKSAAKATASVVAVIVIAAVLLSVPGWLRESATVSATGRFKQAAVVEVKRLTTDLSGITNQIAAMVAQTGEDDKWLSKHLILMKSGEWVAFVSKCHKEDHKIRDTFVCYASDGRWYESSFHFCKSVFVLRMEGQPLDLATFIVDHKLNELPDLTAR